MANNTHLSLFSGIGGLDLAAEWAGFRTVAFVERDRYCQRVLAKHWPGVPIFGDVAEISMSGGCMDAQTGKSQQEREFGDSSAGNFERIPPIGLLSGGFPCQPHSVAGKRKASADERDLWSECVRITAEFKPRWAVFENVPGLLSSEGGTFFARVLGDLAALGYRVGWGVWGANDVGALHRRDRVFIVAHSADDGSDRNDAPGNNARQKPEDSIEQWRRWNGGTSGCSEDVADADKPGPQGRNEREWSGGFAWTGDRPLEGIWGVEPPVGRVAHGVPKRVDRLRALGNAVVPQQAYPIFKAIAEIEGIGGRSHHP